MNSPTFVRMRTDHTELKGTVSPSPIHIIPECGGDVGNRLSDHRERVTGHTVASVACLSDIRHDIAVGEYRTACKISSRYGTSAA